MSSTCEVMGRSTVTRYSKHSAAIIPVSHCLHGRWNRFRLLWTRLILRSPLFWVFLQWWMTKIRIISLKAISTLQMFIQMRFWITPKKKTYPKLSYPNSPTLSITQYYLINLFDFMVALTWVVVFIPKVHQHQNNKC